MYDPSQNFQLLEALCSLLTLYKKLKLVFSTKLINVIRPHY